MLKTIGIWRMLTSSIKAAFELAVNHFRKSFSVKPVCLAATKNRISRNSFQFDQNLPHLTRKSFYIFILPSTISFQAQKKKRAIERKNSANQKRERARERTIQTPISERTKRLSASEPNANQRTKHWSSKQTKRRSSHDPNADPVNEPNANFIPLQSRRAHLTTDPSR